MTLPIKIALKFLISNRAQTILIAIGIAIGVSVQIFIGSLIQGLQKDLIEKTVGSSPHITISQEKSKNGISDYVEKMQTALKINGVKYVSEAVDKNAFLTFNNNAYPVLVRGFDIGNADNIYKINKRIIQGTSPINNNQILIGSDLKKELACNVGDVCEIVTPEGIKKIFKISGIYDLKVSSINSLWVISNKGAAQEISNLNDKVTSIEIQVNDVFKADSISNSFNKNDVFRNLLIRDWKTQNQQLLSGLVGQSTSSIMIQVFVMISVILGIASVLAISVIQKSKQIGILKAMGITNFRASLIFLSQGIMLGILGAILGTALGLGLEWSFTKFAVNGDGTPIVPLYINVKFICLSAMIAIVSSSIASIIPAISSSKLEPMEVIRNG